VPVTTYDKAPDTADQLSVNPDVETPVTLSPVGVVRTVVTAAAWFDAPDVPPELDAVSVNGPYVTATVRGVLLPSVYDVVAAVPEIEIEPPGMLAPVSVYDVTVPPGEPHVNGMVVPVGVPVARLDGALGAVYAVIEPVVPPSVGPPEIPTLVRDWSVNEYAVPGLARLDTVYPVDDAAVGKRVEGPPTRMYDSAPVAFVHVRTTVWLLAVPACCWKLVAAAACVLIVVVTTVSPATPDELYDVIVNAPFVDPAVTVLELTVRPRPVWVATPVPEMPYDIAVPVLGANQLIVNVVDVMLVNTPPTIVAESVGAYVSVTSAAEATDVPPFPLGLTD
jgi:hypothetical protein